MRQDAWRAYLEMALGVTEASGKKALKTAKRLVGKSGVSADQLQGMADELVRASAANREAVRNLVRVELDRALNAVGLAKSDEVETLTARVRELEARLQAAKAAEPAGADSGSVPSSLTAPVKKTVAKKAEPAPAAVDEAPVAKTVAKKTVAKKVAGEPAAAPATATGPAGVAGAAKVAGPAEGAKASGPAKAAAPAKAAKATPAKKVAAKAAPKVVAKTAGKGATKVAPAKVGAKITAPAGSESRGAVPARKAVKKTTTKRTPASGEPVP